MDKERMSEGLISNFLGSTSGFTPITVSADFAALRCPPCRSEETEGIEEYVVPAKKAA